MKSNGGVKSKMFAFEISTRIENSENWRSEQVKKKLAVLSRKKSRVMGLLLTVMGPI